MSAADNKQNTSEDQNQKKQKKKGKEIKTILFKVAKKFTGMCLRENLWLHQRWMSGRNNTRMQKRHHCVITHVKCKRVWKRNA